jgi:hypothetical protein
LEVDLPLQLARHYEGNQAVNKILRSLGTLAKATWSSPSLGQQQFDTRRMGARMRQLVET